MNWETTTATLLQEYQEQLLRGGTSKPLKDDQAQALAARDGGHKRDAWKKKSGSKTDKRRCYGCGGVGNIAHDCFSRSRKTTKQVAFADGADGNFDSDLGRAQQARLLIAREAIVEDHVIHSAPLPRVEGAANPVSIDSSADQGTQDCVSCEDLHAFWSFKKSSRLCHSKTPLRINAL